jgi:hypothetical protein
VHTAPAPPCPLTLIAWRLAGLTLNDVWWRHLELGGTSSRVALADYLHSTDAWPATAHNVLAHTLNEALWELGCPSLAPYRPPANDPQHVPLQTGQGRHEAS